MSGTGGTNQSPWDVPLFRRPNAADFNDCQKIDDPDAAPPNPQTDPSAEEDNTAKLSIVAMAAMIPSAEVSVTPGVSPVITSVISPCDNLNGELGAFTLTRNGAGDYWVELTNATSMNNMPAVVGQPQGYLNIQCGPHNFAIGTVYGTGPAFGNQAIRVTTIMDATLADLNFTVVFR
jgi:hypothetical protein